MLMRRLGRSFLQLLIALLVIAAAVAAFRWGLLPVLERVFDLDAQASATLRRGGILVALVLAYWAFVRLYERRPASELRPAAIPVALGIGLGVAMIGSVVLLLYAFGVYEVTAYRGLQGELAGIAATVLVAAMIEEVLFRGVLFLALESALGTRSALWAQALLFSVLHIANIDASAMDTEAWVITVVSGTLIGAFWTVLFVLTRNLWVVALNHAAWNFTIVLTGLPLSGLEDWRRAAPLESIDHGPRWLGGGAVGPEDSVLTQLMVMAVLAALLHAARRRNRLKAPQQTSTGMAVAAGAQGQAQSAI